MASTTESTNKILLKSNDGEEFEVDVVVAEESLTIKHMIEDDCADSVIPLPNVTGKILSKVIEYCKKRVELVDKKNGSDSTTYASYGSVNGGENDELKT
ncbi:hypothetical protein RND81_14G210600 [Saponaria officinalis]|uniref:SKP1 component POZ domain-containing protein n=1 Tax=Saponaria officinalis TaxID=3572 RepID=A0AAW1GS92_SAPOF